MQYFALNTEVVTDLQDKQSFTPEINSYKALTPGNLSMKVLINISAQKHSLYQRLEVI